MFTDLHLIWTLTDYSRRKFLKHEWSFGGTVLPIEENPKIIAKSFLLLILNTLISKTGNVQKTKSTHADCLGAHISRTRGNNAGKSMNCELVQCWRRLKSRFRIADYPFVALDIENYILQVGYLRTMFNKVKVRNYNAIIKLNSLALHT